MRCWRLLLREFLIPPYLILLDSFCLGTLCTVIRSEMYERLFNGDSIWWGRRSQISKTGFAKPQCHSRCKSCTTTTTTLLPFSRRITSLLFFLPSFLPLFLSNNLFFPLFTHPSPFAKLKLSLKPPPAHFSSLHILGTPPSSSSSSATSTRPPSPARDGRERLPVLSCPGTVAGT